MNTGRTHWVRHAWLAMAGALVVFGCGEDYKFVPDPPKDAAVPDAPDGDGSPVDLPPSTPTACATDDECSALANTQLCDTKGGYCVECDPTREAELDRCGNGTFCGADGHCTLGCQKDADCLGISCDTTRGLCVNCVNDSNCAPGTTCADAVCTPSCDSNDSCPSGWLCCDSTCKNPETDVSSCGTCDKVCAEGDACWNGVCGEGPCASGTAECDGDASNGCETPTQDDPANCGKCRLACASDFCAGGRCTTMNCVSGTADCNGDESDHCETDLTDVDNCTMCDEKCSDVHGKPSCGKSGCAIACDDGYDDCDKKVGTGCEIDLQTDEKHCGDCDTQCTNDNGTTKCQDGECKPRCADGFADCDGDPTNGCETDTNSAIGDCGGCGQKCSPDNATGSCKDGVCQAKCATGFADCDGNKANGCEADLSSPATCGSCDTSCSENGGKAKCNPADGSCTIKCDVGRADCLNGLADGCETDITASANNCGGCGHVCTSSVGTAACSDSVCGVSTCTAPLETCPGAGKCETNLSNDANNCGDCGHTCSFPSASGKCVNRACELDQCDDGRKDCNGVPSDGCEVALGTTDNCRTCGEACKNDHGTNQCTTNGCSPSCAQGWGDCDGNKNNGCETHLTTTDNCGGCGVACTRPHGTPDCSTGVCAGSCDPGWDNCNNEASAKDGCETHLTNATNCGGCGVPCNLANATTSCGTGVCQLTACNTGFGDCNSQPGCETPLFNVTNCNSCGDTCGSVNAPSPQCVATGTGSVHVCQLSCATHFGDCDGNKTNGCETQLNSKTNCGACGGRCDDLANATGSCSTYACVQACKAGFLDCTAADGCETPSGTTANCTQCGETCTNAHGSAGCGVSGCTASCTDPLWGNCDTNAANGCEASLRTISNCNVCGATCASNYSCSTGACVLTSCPAGSDDCDHNGSCETTLNSVNNCNACGHQCVAQNGTTSCSGTTAPYVCKPSCNTGFGDCNTNPDDGCETPFKTLTDCTACGDACAKPHATATCTSGSCQINACSTGFRNCNTESSAKDGCETSISASPNCGACGVTCQAVNGTNPCTGSGDAYACAPSCNPGFAACNGAANGCGTPLKTLTDCTGCGDVCSKANATFNCNSGSCQIQACVGNFLDCSANEATAKDGCETAIDNAHCGSCTKACSTLNATSNNCSGNGLSSVCQPVCLGGFGDCDTKPETGCETDLKTTANCGVCGRVCTAANATPICSAGACGVGACNAGFADCNGVPTDGCEVQLGVNGNCSKCGETCSSSNGTNSCDSTAKICKPVCNANFGTCDGDPSNGCETDLKTVSNCGACGNVCSGATPDCIGVTSGTTTTYRCQSRVTYMNDAESSSNTATLDFTHSLSTGTNRIVIAAIVSETNNSTGLNGARPETVTYGSIAMTAVPNGWFSTDGSTAGFDTPQLFYYYLTDTGTNKLPTSGSEAVHIDASAGTDDPPMIAANVIAFSGVSQTTPIALGAGIRLANPGSTCLTTSAVTLPLPGSAVYALSAAQYYGLATTPAQGGIATVMNLDNIGHQVHVYAGYNGGYPTVLTAASYTIGFSYNWCNPAGNLPIAIAPVRQP